MFYGSRIDLWEADVSDKFAKLSLLATKKLFWQNE